LHVTADGEERVASPEQSAEEEEAGQGKKTNEGPPKDRYGYLSKERKKKKQGKNNVCTLKGEVEKQDCRCAADATL